MGARCNSQADPACLTCADALLVSSAAALVSAAPAVAAEADGVDSTIDNVIGAVRVGAPSLIVGCTADGARRVKALSS